MATSNMHIQRPSHTVCLIYSKTWWGSPAACCQMCCAWLRVHVVHITPNPPARLHADDMNNRSPAIKARVWEGWQTSLATDADLCTLTEKNSSQMVKCAAWLGGGGGGLGEGMEAGSWEETPKCVPAGEGDRAGEAQDKAGLACTLMGRADAGERKTVVS